MIKGVISRPLFQNANFRRTFDKSNGGAESFRQNEAPFFDNPHPPKRGVRQMVWSRLCPIWSILEGDLVERGKRPVSLQDRLAAFARLNHEAAEKLPPGPERDLLLEKARKADEAARPSRTTRRRPASGDCR